MLGGRREMDAGGIERTRVLCACEKSEPVCATCLATWASWLHDDEITLCSCSSFRRMHVVGRVPSPLFFIYYFNPFAFLAFEDEPVSTTISTFIDRVD